MIRRARYIFEQVGLQHHHRDRGDVDHDAMSGTASTGGGEAMSDLPDAREAEIARLRDALEKIALAKLPPGHAYWTDHRAAEGYWALFDRCRRIAGAALEPKP